MTFDEGNELIAVYRGAIMTEPYSDYIRKAKKKDEEDIVLSGKIFTFHKDKEGKETSPGIYRNIPLSGLKYHLSWEWLVPIMLSLDIYYVQKDIEICWHQCVIRIKTFNHG